MLKHILIIVIACPIYMHCIIALLHRYVFQSANYQYFKVLIQGDSRRMSTLCTNMLNVEVTNTVVHGLSVCRPWGS